MAEPDGILHEQVTLPDSGDDLVDPTGVLRRRDVQRLRHALDHAENATRLRAFDGEAQWFAALLASGDELAPDYPASEATHLDWAFQVAEGSALADDERIAPGITEYVGHLMERAAELCRQTLSLFREQYRTDAPMHLGVETPFALTRMELEVIGRIRAIIVPAATGARVKAYVAARHYDLKNAEVMTKTPQKDLEELEALIPRIEPLDGEPNVHRFADPSKPPLERWRLNPGAAARHLASSNKGPKLYWQLSEAVHGGGLVQKAWFAHGESFGFELIRRCIEVLRAELVELNAVYLRYASGVQAEN